jgi:crossover junction endodeoxyribonuclease RusA
MQTINIKTSPVSINKRYTIARNRNILSNEYRAAKEAMEWEIKGQFRGEILTDDNLCVNLFIYYKGRKADIDAYIKIILDAMTGIVYEDDKQINELSVVREKSEADGIVVQVF